MGSTVSLLHECSHRIWPWPYILFGRQLEVRGWVLVWGRYRTSAVQNWALILCREGWIDIYRIYFRKWIERKSWAYSDMKTSSLNILVNDIHWSKPEPWVLPEILTLYCRRPVGISLITVTINATDPWHTGLILNKPLYLLISEKSEETSLFPCKSSRYIVMEKPDLRIETLTKIVVSFIACFVIHSAPIVRISLNYTFYCWNNDPVEWTSHLISLS